MRQVLLPCWNIQGVGELSSNNREVIAGISTVLFQTLNYNITDYIQVLAIMNKAAIRIHVQDFVWMCISVPLGKYRGMQLLGGMVKACLVL